LEKKKKGKKKQKKRAKEESNDTLESIIHLNSINTIYNIILQMLDSGLGSYQFNHPQNKF